MLPILSTRLLSVLLAAERVWRRWLSSVRHRRLVTAILVVVFFAWTSASVFAAEEPKASTSARPDPSLMARLGYIIAEGILWIALGVGKLISSLIEVAVVPLMQYNNFSNSPVVSAGWTIVRDSVNLFFVIILIAIAVGTIFGVHRFQWQQQVPRLLLMAVVINFSKTLVGLMIDVSQVFMLTFVNALKDIAGGNFITLLGLNDIVGLNPAAPGLGDLSSAGSEAAGAFDYLTSSVAALLMMILVLAVMVALVAILAFRIVMLWILITIAPIAWFIKGAEGVINSNAYNEWWNNFKCQLLIGPVLTFFLWLALAVAGAGNLAATEAFKTGTGAASGGFITKIFELGRLTSFIIGMAMIFAGFKAAGDVCSGVEGQSIISGALGKAKQLGFNLPAGLMARYSARGLRGAGRLAARETVGRIPLVQPQGQAAALRTLQRGAGKLGAVGRPLVRGLGAAAGAREELAASQMKAAGETYQEKESKKIFAKQMSDQALKGKKPLSQDTRMQATDMLRQALDDKDLQKAMGPEGFKAMFQQYGKDLSATFHHDYEEFMKKRPDMVDTSTEEGKKEKEKFLKEINNMDDVKKLDKAALADTEVQSRLKQVATEKDGVSAYDAIRQGKLGVDKKNALLGERPAAEVSRTNVAAIFSGDKYRADVGAFKDDAAQQEFIFNVTENVESIGSIPTGHIDRNGGNNQIVSAVAENIETGKVRQMLNEYLRAPADRKATLQPSVDNLGKTISYAVEQATGDERKKLEKLQNTIEQYQARARGEAPAGGPVGSLGALAGGGAVAGERPARRVPRPPAEGAAGGPPRTPPPGPPPGTGGAPPAGGTPT